VALGGQFNLRVRRCGYAGDSTVVHGALGAWRVPRGFRARGACCSTTALFAPPNTERREGGGPWRAIVRQDLFSGKFFVPTDPAGAADRNRFAFGVMGARASFDRR